MADKNGIVIGVGFDPDVQSGIDKIENDFKNVNWDKVIGLSDSFDQEYKRIVESLKALKKEIGELGILDVAELTNGLNSITQTTYRLQKQFDALVTSLPVNVQAKMNKSLGGVVNIMEEIGRTSAEATQAVTNAVNTVNNTNINDSKFIEFQDRLKEINKLLNNTVIKEKFEAGKLVDKTSFKSLDEAKAALRDMYDTYNTLVNQFKSNPKEFKSFEELKNSFYNLRAMLNDVMSGLDPEGISGKLDFDVSQIIDFNKGKPLKDKLKNTYVDAVGVIVNEYRKIHNQLKVESQKIINEGKELGYNLTEITKHGVNDATRKVTTDNIDFHLPIVIDEKSKEKFNESLNTLIEDAQEIADNNPVRLAIDITSQYKASLDKKTLDKINEMTSSINEKLEDELSKDEKKRNKNLIKNLSSDLGRIKQMAKTLEAGFDKTYAIEIGVHTEWAAKQVKLFIQNTKKQLDELKQNIVLGPEIAIDDDFQKRLEESTEKAIKKLEEYTVKIADSLEIIKDFFTNGSGLSDDKFLQPEKVALGTLYRDLKQVADEVKTVTDAFQMMRGEADEELKNGVVASINKAVNSVSKSLGEKLIKQLEIELINKDKLEDAIIDLWGRLQDLYDTRGLKEWEIEYLKVIQNIDRAFAQLIGTEDKLSFVTGNTQNFDTSKLTDLVPFMARVSEAANELNQSLTGIGNLNNVKPSVAIDLDSITQAIISALQSTTVNVSIETLRDIIYSAISEAISGILNQSTQIDSNMITEAIRSAIDISSITNIIDTALKQSSTNIDVTTLTQGLQSAIDLTSIINTINSLPLKEIQSSLQQIISILQIENQSPEDLQTYINNLDKEISEYTNKINLLKSAASNKPESIKNNSTEDQFPRINAISKAVVDALQNAEISVNYEPLREIISSAILDAVINKNSSITSVEGLSNIINSAIKEIKPQSVNEKNLSNAISSGIQQALPNEGNGIDLISYMAKDLALSDKAIIHNGRSIDKEDVEAILKYYGVSTVGGKAAVNKAAGNKIISRVIKDIEDFVVKSSTEHGGILTGDLKLYGLSGADATHSTAYSDPEVWRQIGVDISKGILSIIHSHAGDEFWVPSVADFKNAIAEKDVSPYSTTLSRQQISVMDTKQVSGIFKNYTESDWASLSNEIDNLASKIISEGFKNLPEELRKKTDELIKLNTYNKISDPEAYKRNTETLPAYYAATEQVLKKRFNVTLNSFSKLFDVDKFAKGDPYDINRVISYISKLNNNKSQNIPNPSNDQIQNWKEYNEELALGVERIEKVEQLKKLGITDPDTLYGLITMNDKYFKRANLNKDFDIIQYKEKLLQELLPTKELENAFKQQLKNAYNANSKGFINYLGSNEGNGYWTTFRTVDNNNQGTANFKDDYIFKVYGTFKDIADLNKETVSEILQELNNAGFKGTVKIPGQQGFRQAISSDQIVIHGNDLNMQEIAYNVLTKLFGNIFSNVQGGYDKNIGLGTSFSQLLSGKGTTLNSQNEIAAATKLYQSRIDSSNKPRSISSSNEDGDIQAAIKVNEQKLQELIEEREIIQRLIESASKKTNNQETNLAKAFDFSSVDFESLNNLNIFLKSYISLIDKLENTDKISSIATNFNTLSSALSSSSIGNNSLLNQLNEILLKSKELDALAKVLKGGTQNIANVAKSAGTKSKQKSTAAELLTEDEQLIKDLTTEYLSNKGYTIFSLDNLKATKDGLVEITALIRNAEGEAEQIKLLFDDDPSFKMTSRKGAESTVSKIERTQAAEAEAAVIEAQRPIIETKKLMDELIDQSKQIPKILNSAFSGNAVADQDITRVFEYMKELFDALQTYPNELINKDQLTSTMQYITGEIDTVENKLNKINTNNKNVTFNATLSGLIEQLKEIKGLLVEGNFDEATGAIARFATQLNDLGGSQNDSVVVKIGQVDKLLGRINEELNRNPSMPRKVKKELEDIRTDIEKVRQQSEGGLVSKETFDDLNNRFLAAQEHAKRAYNSITSMLKRSAMSIARMYLSWYRWISYIRQGVTEVMNMDTALTKMSYTMNVTDAQLQDMSNQMVQMARDLSSSVSNIQQIYQIYANLQTTQEELEKTAKPTAILANLSGVDASTAADQIQGVLNQFNMTADAASHVVDVYDKISASIKVDYSKGIAGMAEAVQNVGNYAEQAGVSFEQLSAIVAKVMEKTRQEGSSIGNALRTIMVRLSKANKLADPDEVDNATLSNASKALNEIGIQVYTLEGEYREFDTIMSELATKWDTLNDAQKSNISFNIAATRQATILNAILQQYDESMELATEATNANGNAMANQQKYMESVAGQVQAVKTELSALWLELLKSDSIKEILSSVKDFIVSLQNSTTGLKPVVDMLSSMLSIITKLMSVIPKGGLLATIIGLKFGSKVIGFDSGIKEWTGSLVTFKKAIEMTTSSTNIFSKALAGVGVAFKANPIGFIITGLTLLQTVISATTKNLDDLKQEYDELASESEKIRNEIVSINSELQTQQDLINDLQSKKLSYIEQEQLDNAKAMTAELELQKKLKEDEYRSDQVKQADKDLEIWKASGYLFDKNQYQQWQSEYQNVATKVSPSQKSLALKAFGDKLNNTSVLARVYTLGLKEFEEDQLDQARTEISDINKYLLNEDNKNYYESLKNATDPLNTFEQEFVDAYDYLTAIANNASKILHPIEWDKLQIATTQSNINKNDTAKKELDALALQYQKMTVPTQYDSKGFAVNPFEQYVEALREEIESGKYPNLLEEINKIEFSDEDADAVDAWVKSYVAEYKKDAEEAATEIQPPISYSKWINNESSIIKNNGEKDDGAKYKNKELIDAYKEAVDSLGSFITNDEEGKVHINLGEVIRITGDEQSLYQQLGMDDFEEYVKKFGNNSDAFLHYMSDVEEKINEGFGGDLTEEGRQQLLDDLEAIRNAGLGTANDVYKIEDSYWELREVYKEVADDKRKFNKEEMDYMLNKYPELQKNVTKLADGSYEIQKEALESLINEYGNLSNAAINSARTQSEELLQLALDTAHFAMTLQDAVRIYQQFQAGVGAKFTLDGEEAVKDLPFNDDIVKKIENYIKTRKLDYKNTNSDEDKDSGSNSKNKDNEIDWIANSLENIQKKIDETQEKYDRLFTTSGSKKQLNKANNFLTDINDLLDDQIEGLKTAKKAYLNELDKLGLSPDQIEKIKNVALGNTDAWEIERFKETDSELYEKLTEGLKYYQAAQDAAVKKREKEHQQELNDIQKLQNEYDYLAAKQGKFEAKLTLATSAKQQAKITTKIIKLQDEEYKKQIEIAKKKKDTTEATRLQYEWEQKTNESIAQRRQYYIDEINTKYDRKVSEFENRKSILEHGIAMTEANGAMVSVNYYKALIDNEKKKAEDRLAERKKLVAELNRIESEGIKSTEDLNQWWDTKDKIDEVTAVTYAAEEAMVEYGNAIRQVKWDLFDRIQATISGIKDETNYLIDAMSNKDMYKYIKETFNDGSTSKLYQGDWSDEGLATLGLRELNIKTNTELVQKYREEIEKLNNELSDKPTDLTLLDRRNELISAEREAALAVEQEKDAIIDLVKDGYDKQIASLETLSSKYMEALNAEKDLYDYQKNIQKQTKDILTLRKRIASLQGDTSEEARSRRQQLQVQLKDAQEGLRDTQYDHYLSDQQQVLDKLQSEFESFLNDKLDDRETLLKEMSKKVDSNKEVIKQTLVNTGNNLGTGITNTMNNIWNSEHLDNISIQGMISPLDTDLKAISKSTTNTDSILANYLKDYDIEELVGSDGKLEKIYGKIDEINTNLGEYLEALPKTEGHVGGVVSAGISGATSGTQSLADIIGDKLKKSAGYHGIKSSNIYPDAVSWKQYQGVSREQVESAYNSTGELVNQYGRFNGPQFQLEQFKHWLIRNGYASGTRRIKRDELAWTQEKGLEAIIRPSDGAILTPLAKNDSVLNAGATQNIWDMANNPLQFIKDTLSPINLPSVVSGGNYDIQQSMAITLPSVMNYPEFVTALQNDKKFERMLQDMTVNQLDKKNTLAKYKYQY